MFETSYIVPACFIIVSTLFGYMIYQDYQHEKSLTAEELAERKLREYCISKVRGSRPACWTAADWVAYCRHVECKTLKPIKD